MGGVLADTETHFGAVRNINSDNSQLFGFHGGAHVALCDGAVRLLDESTSRIVVGALLARNDGSPIVE